MNNCKACKNPVVGNFCSNCGLAVTLNRINSAYILQEIRQVVQLEKGVLFTIKELLIRPGNCIREFVVDDRNRLIKPFVFIILSSLIYGIVSHYFTTVPSYIDFDKNDLSSQNLIFGWVQNNYGYANIIIGAFIAIWLKLFFRKYDYNFFEILILLCFVMGVVMLINSIFTIYSGLTTLPVMKNSSILCFIYSSWAIGQFFDGKKIKNYFKAFAAYTLGFISFVLMVVLLAEVFDLIMKTL